MNNRELNSTWTCILLALTLAGGMNGCAAFHPVRGVPAVYLPEDYLGEERGGRETINLSLLVRGQPEQHHIEAGDLLAVFIPGVLGSVSHTDDSSGENPPITNPLGENLLPTIGYPILVQDDHTISLPYLPTINVYGLTTEQAAERVRQTALSLGILRSEMGKDRVLISLQQPRQYRVLVVRQEATSDVGSSQPGSINVGTSKRGTAQLVSLPAYENDVLHALMGNRSSTNSGLPGLDAKNYIYVIRGRRGQHASYPGMGPMPGQVPQQQMGMPAQMNTPGYGAPQQYVPQQPWNGSVPMNQGMQGAPTFDAYGNPLGVPAGGMPVGQYPSGSYYPQPEPTPAAMPGQYGQSQPGMVIRGQSDILPVSHWSPGSHARQLNQLDPAPTWGHSFHYAAQTTPPAWNGNSPMPAPAPSPLSGGGVPYGTPNPMAPAIQDVPLLHPSLDPGVGGHSITVPSQPVDPPLRTEVPEVPLLHPSLAPQSTGVPRQMVPAPQPAIDPRWQSAPAPTGPYTDPSRTPNYPTDMQAAPAPQMMNPQQGTYPPASTGYVDPSIQQMAAMQGTPYDGQWAATLGGWSPTVESPDIIKIPVRLAPGQVPYLTEEDITLYDGDIVFIESRDSEVFYTGGLLGGGQYTLPRDNDLRVTQAVSIASARSQSGSTRAIGGISALNQDVSNSASRVVILRTLPCGQRVQIEVDLYKAFRFEDEDIIIQPGDMILLQFKCHEAIAAAFERYLLEGALLGIAAGSLTGGGGGGGGGN